MAERIPDDQVMPTTAGAIRKAAANCTTAAAALKTLYPDVFAVTAFTTEDLNSDHDEIQWRHPNGDDITIISPRNGGNYRYRGFYLNDDYHTWTLTTDDNGYLILVPETRQTNDD